MTINGKKYLVNFGTAKAIVYFENDRLLTFIITEKDSSPANIKETVRQVTGQLRPEFFLVYGQEKNGTPPAVVNA